MTEKPKTPTWMYRAGPDGAEAHLFADVGDVPKGAGWVDSPAKITPKAASTEKDE